MEAELVQLSPDVACKELKFDLWYEDYLTGNTCFAEQYSFVHVLVLLKTCFASNVWMHCAIVARALLSLFNSTSHYMLNMDNAPHRLVGAEFCYHSFH